MVHKATIWRLFPVQWNCWNVLGCISFSLMPLINWQLNVQYVPRVFTDKRLIYGQCTVCKGSGFKKCTSAWNPLIWCIQTTVLSLCITWSFGDKEQFGESHICNPQRTWHRFPWFGFMSRLGQETIPRPCYSKMFGYIAHTLLALKSVCSVFHAWPWSNMAAKKTFHELSRQ